MKSLPGDKIPSGSRLFLSTGKHLSLIGVRHEIDKGPYFFVTERTTVSGIPSGHRGAPDAVFHGIDKRTPLFSPHSRQRRGTPVLTVTHETVREEKLSSPFPASPFNMASSAGCTENLPGLVFLHMNGILHMHAQGQCRYRPRRIVRINPNRLQEISRFPPQVYRHSNLSLLSGTQPT
jgi:hypothetical protein